MKFDLQISIAILERTPAVLQQLLYNLPEAWTIGNEGGDSWSPYVVVGHLIHGEKTDWIPRMQIILNHGINQPFEPFDRFAQMNNKDQPLNELLQEFTRLRQENLRILKNQALDESALQRQGTHPAFGTVTLRQLLATWTAHDLGHLVQIARVMAKQYQEEVGPWQAYLKVMQ